MSMPAEKFDQSEFDKMWSSTKQEGGITLGTLFHYAKEFGWSDPKASNAQDSRDIKAGRLFADANRGKLLFVAETNELLKFEPTAGWVRANFGEADQAAKGVVLGMRTRAVELFKQDHESKEAKELLKLADCCSTAQRLQAMIQLAKSESGMSASLAQFDADPELLGVQNGILNLRTRQLLPITPVVRVSKRATVAYDPAAKCQKLVAFMSEIQPDAGMRRLLQQLAGVFLHGDSTLQKLIFFYGQGANGKSTLIELLAWLLGDYVKKIPTEMLMHHQRSPQGPSPDIVGLKGRRLVYCNEVEEGRKLAEARVKDLTGGDTLTGRVPYAKEDLTFQPTHKLVMVGNHQPEIQDMSHGMWRRMLLIPFDQVIPDGKRDPHLLEKLKAEGSGILNWALDGYHDYLRHGLRVPPIVDGATAAYKDEQDIIGEWISDHCNIVPGALTAKGDLYKAYTYWARSHGHFPLAQPRFIRRLADRGYRLDAGRRKVVNLELNFSGQMDSARMA